MELILIAIEHNLRKMVAKAIDFYFFISKTQNKQAKKLIFSVFVAFQESKTSVLKNEEQ